MTQQPITKIPDASRMSGSGKGLEAISILRNSTENRTEESHGEEEPLRQRPIETALVMRCGEDSPRSKTWGRRLEMPVFEGITPKDRFFVPKDSSQCIISPRQRNWMSLP